MRNERVRGKTLLIEKKYQKDLRGERTRQWDLITSGKKRRKREKTIITTRLNYLKKRDPKLPCDW